MPSSDGGRTTRKERRRSLPSSSGLLDAAQRFWQKSYAGDYLGLTLLVVGYILLKMVDEPFHQMFSLDDLRLQHPHAEVERVSVFQLFMYAALAPFCILAIYLLAIRQDFHKAHVTILGLVIVILSTSFITDIIKDAVGRPRPDLIARCKPGIDSPHDQLVTIAVCKETDHHTLHDGWRSFPSGHSSFAWAGLGWLALFIASQTHVLRPRASLIAVGLSVAPLVAAILIAISRLEDYRHDVEDVIAGSVLGFSIALFNWRRYWPSLLLAECDTPYPPPFSTKTDLPRGEFSRIRDEEDGPSNNERFIVEEER